jgi:hypothetical protein
MRTMHGRMVGLLALVLASGCLDLDVSNTNDPDREQALRQPSDVETLAASTWRDFWSRWQNDDDTYNLFPVVADAFSATYANHGALELSSEPRVAFNNSPLAETQLMSRTNWESFNKIVSSGNDVLSAIARGLVIMTPREPGGPVTDNTKRTFVFAKMAQALAYGHVAMLYDRAIIANEYLDLSVPGAVRQLEYSPHPQVFDSAFVYMRAAIDTAAKYAFSLPAPWINGTTFTNVDLVKQMNSYLARLLVYGTRTPEERAALDWNRVLNYLDNGITADYNVTLLSGTLTSGFMSRLQQNGTFSAWGDYKMIGLADVSGSYQAWLARPVQQRDRFLITTPDRRITGPTPSSNGTYFRYRADNIMRPERGTYHHSYYQWFRNAGRTNSGTLTLMSLDEMSLLRAEALIRLNRAAEAVPLINRTRTRTQRIGTTDYAGLPPVTAAGVPESADCVPRTATGTCGSLLDALLYERMIETYALDALIAYFDSRGWGRLPAGTFLHLPVPGRELQSSGYEIYSFGGVGGPGAAK